METTDNIDLKEFINKYVTALCNQRAAVFMGAGMSCSCGYVDWEGLMEPLVQTLGLDKEAVNDFPTLVQYYVNKEGTRGELNGLLKEMLTPNAAISGSMNHRILAELPIYDYWTTNYDDLIEQSLKNAGRKFCMKSCTDDFLYPTGHDSAVVYKMHGDKRDISNIVLTRDDYENYNRSRQIFTYQFQCALVSKTFLFLGFSFKDANINFILGQLRGKVEMKNKPKCYYFIKRETGKNRIVQELNIKLLAKYGLYAIEVDDYPEITSILQEIVQCYRRRTIIISGTACDYGKWGKVQAELFMEYLSYHLMKEGYSVVNRMGSQVGQAVAKGAVNAMKYHSRKEEGSLPSHEIFPFSLKQKEYEGISSLNPGIYILLFGNRLEYDKVVTDRDWVEEAGSAASRGMKIIPVGATGYAAGEVWNEVMENLETYYPGLPANLKYTFDSLSPAGLAGTELKGTYNRLSDEHYQCYFDDIPGAVLIKSILQIVKFLQKKQ